MPENNGFCKYHTGFDERIKGVEKTCTEQWEHINGLSDKLGNVQANIMTRINVLLGGIVVACILLVINLAVGK